LILGGIFLLEVFLKIFFFKLLKKFSWGKNPFFWGGKKNPPPPPPPKKFSGNF